MRFLLMFEKLDKKKSQNPPITGRWSGDCKKKTVLSG